MKKITLCAIALMASATSFAQTTLWNGEENLINDEYHIASFWKDGTPELVENPEKDGINTSAHCIKFTMTNDNKVVKLPFKDWIQPSMNGSKRISLMIKKAGENVDVKEDVMVELSDPTNGGEGYWKKQVVEYTGGGKWQKLVFDYTANGDFDYPGVMTITAQNGIVFNNHDVYIDNIVIEDAPRINGQLLYKYNGMISGNVTLTGAWMKVSSTKADGLLEENTYDDYVEFNSKADATLTSVDLREAQASDVDVNQFFYKNPNTIVYAKEAYNHANVVAKQKFTNANNEEVTDLYAKNGLVLADVDANANAYAFSCPYAFTAANVKLTRTVREGINSFVLPFYVGASDLGAEALATFNKNKEADGKSVFFTKFDHADANVPFITVGLKDAAENKEFTFFGNQKLVEATPASFDGAFKGVYAPQSAENLYGIDADGKLHKGGASATINAFHAYYQPAANASVPAKISFDGEATGINAVTTTSTSANGAVYDLSGRRVAANLAAAKLAKGIYVVNGKKVAVK